MRNGERGEVLKTWKDGLTVRLEDGRKVEVDMGRYSALDHGYAMTTYKSQGQTYDKVVVEADTSAPQLQDQRNTYVQITRARDDVRVFTDDQAGLREVSAILNYKTDTFGVDVSLEKAAAMERRVHAEAFGDRARSQKPRPRSGRRKPRRSTTPRRSSARRNRSSCRLRYRMSITKCSLRARKAMRLRVPGVSTSGGRSTRRFRPTDRATAKKAGRPNT